MKQLLLLLTLGLCIACGTEANASSSRLIAALEKLAAENNAESIYHLGMTYHTGTGVERDYAKALLYFRDATRLNSPLGAYKLGCYFDGQGNGQITRNIDEALKYKLIAAEAGYALAQQDVASIYARQGDFDSALPWLEKSVAQGWSGALMTYASIHNGSDGVEPDPAKTAAYFQLYLDRNDGSATQRDWLRAFERKLSAEQKKQVSKIVAGYQAVPTALTLRALSGQSAAEKLVKLSR